MENAIPSAQFCQKKKMNSIKNLEIQKENGKVTD